MPRTASRKALIAAAVAAAAAGLLRPHLADLPLSHWPILQTHDTGTVYLQPTNEIDEIIYRFTRTQNAQNVTGLLNCGGENAAAARGATRLGARAQNVASAFDAPSSSPARASLQRAHSTGAPSSTETR